MSAISNYFRTALLIDDRVAADYRSPVSQQDGLIEHPDQEPAPSLVPPSEQDVREGETPVHPSELVREFLRARVVCSVLEATDDAEEPNGLVNQVLKGAMIADLLILDWLMPRDRPATIEAIGAVATQYADRLTVIVVFTDVQDLSSIEQRLMDAVGFESVEEGIVRRGNTVVLIIGKPLQVLTEGEARRRASSYDRLPEMIFSDLERIFQGFMPQFVFSGINALRESMPRTLTVFNAGLDAGALIHRALLPEPADAATQFVRLLASDFEQVLHDQRVGDLWHIDSSPGSLANLTLTARLGPLRQRLQSLQPDAGLGEGERAEALEELQRLKALSDEDLTREILARGLSEFGKIGLTEGSMRRAIPELTDALADADVSNQKLAVMMDSTNLGASAPRLEFGVLLQAEPDEVEPTATERAEASWWLCIQPLCDSVRLPSTRAFPFVPVILNADKAEAMICPPDGDPVRVAFDTRPHRMSLVKFSPTAMEAVFAQGDAPDWHFRDVDGVRYQAIARLRPDLTAEVVHRVGAATTRIGVDQSEWLRRSRSS